MSKIKLSPHLVNRKGVLLCSECKEVFVGDEKLSVSRAFAQHVKTVHKPKKPVSNAGPSARGNR